VHDWGFNTTKTIHFTNRSRAPCVCRSGGISGDPDFFKVPAGMMIDDQYNAERMSNFDPDKATPSNTIHAGKNSGI